MRIKKFVTLFSLFTIIYINSAKSEDNQQSLCLTEKDCLSLSAPIIFSKGGLTKFLQTVFNSPEYAQDVLPHDMSHFLQCLDYAQSRYQKRMHGRHVLRIFTHKLRAVPYMNDKAFLTMLDEVFPIMRRYYDGVDQKIATSMKETINKILYNSFLTQFSQFKASPQTFFDALADDITVTLYDTQTVLADVSLDEFRRAFTRFLEIGLSKVVWHAEDGIKTWQSVLNIADRFSKMTEVNMFDSDELYELHDSLLERYCFFLDVVNYDMPLAFFEQIKRDITGTASQLLDDDELELCLETRRQRFTRLLCECEFRLHAHSQGLMIS